MVNEQDLVPMDQEVVVAQTVGAATGWGGFGGGGGKGLAGGGGGGYSGGGGGQWSSQLRGGGGGSRNNGNNQSNSRSNRGGAGIVYIDLLYDDVTINISGIRGFTYPLFCGIIPKYSM